MPDSDDKRTDVSAQPFDLFARASVLGQILASKDDLSEMKHRVMLAREHGHLTDIETAQIIKTWGLRDA